MTETDEIKFKTFPIRMSVEFNSKLREKAHREGITTHQFILKAIAEKLERDKAV